MKDMIKISSRLGVICAVAAIVLALVNSVTAPEIAAYQKRVIEEAIQQVSIGYEIGEDISSTDESITSIVGIEKEGNTAGYVMNITAKGYGGPMVLLTSFTTSGELIAVRLLTNAETPGLGKKAETQEYMTKFIGTGDNTPVPVKKSNLTESQADAISGATVTFSGIAKALLIGSSHAIQLGGTN